MQAYTHFDYIIVGAGLAGIAFAETCLNNNKSIFVFDNHSQNSSKIAGGLYNPVILKRFSGLENAQEQLNELDRFYKKLENKLLSKFDYKFPILRKFFSVEEMNNWFAASDKDSLAPFLSLEIINDQIAGIDAPFGFGEVLQTGFVNTAHLLEKYQQYLSIQNSFSNDIFEYNELNVIENVIRYKNISANNIVFAEGFGIHANPYFSYLPLDGTKGELFIVKAPLLDLKLIINTSLFIVPLGNDLFKIGATYNWQDKTDQPTSDGKKELLNKIKEILTCKFEVIQHFAGIRPTVRDRKPLLGTHPIKPKFHIINGLGTRGVMIGPWAAQILFNAIENQTTIEKSININRFIDMQK